MDTEERLTKDSSAKSGGPLFFAGRGEAFPFFSSPELSQRLDLLRHLTENSELIPLVKGPEGSGKSSLIQQLIRVASDNWVIANIEATPMMQPDQLLAILAATFPGAGDDHPMDRLARRFGHLRQEGLLPIVIIDDAQLLPEATIITLLRMHERRQDENILVRILLFAQPEIENLLKTPQIQAMNILSLQALDMPRLTGPQTEQFIKQLLLAEDPTGRLGLNASKMDKIFRDSEGLPGRIAGQVLESVSSGAASTRRAGGLGVGSPLVVAGLVSIGVILVLMLLFQDSINAIFGTVTEDEQKEPVPSSREGKVVPLQIPTLEPEETEPPAVEMPALGEQTAAPGEQPPEPVPVELPVVTKEADTKGLRPEQGEPEVDGAETKTEVIPAPAVTVQEAVTPEAAKAEQTNKEVADSESIAAVAPKEEDKAVSATVETEPKPAVKKPEPVVKKPEPVAETKKAAPVTEIKKAAPAVKPGSEAWLLQQRPSSYTLQLIGLQDEAGVARFLERYKLPGQAAYFRTSRQGKAWFPVLYGIYPNRDAAVAARERLPESLKRAGVWPRSLESVQKEIRNR
jgi:DamX protein